MSLANVSQTEVRFHSHSPGRETWSQGRADVMIASNVGNAYVNYSVYFATTSASADTEGIYVALKTVLFASFDNNVFLSNLQDAADIYSVEALNYCDVSSSTASASAPVVLSSHTPAPSRTPTDTAAITDSSRRRTVLGILVGIGVPVLAGIFLPYVVNEKVTGVYVTLSAGMVAVVLALVLAWATNNDAGATTTLASYYFLGRPDWDTSVFSYHPLFTVGGFYFTIVLALLSRAVIPSRLSVVTQVLTYAAAIACLVVGIMAIVKFKHDAKSPSLTTLHSWLGIICICCFAAVIICNFVVAPVFKISAVPVSAAGGDTACASNPNFGLLQGALELLTLGMTTLTILTGLTMQIGQCNYVNLASYGSDPNPAENYSHLPTACKIVFGLGVCVIVTSILVATVVIHRNQWSSGSRDLKPFVPLAADPAFDPTPVRSTRAPIAAEPEATTAPSNR
jgi:predicted transporter